MKQHAVIYQPPATPPHPPMAIMQCTQEGFPAPLQLAGGPSDTIDTCDNEVNNPHSAALAMI